MRWKSVIFRLSPVVERESRQSTRVSRISQEIFYSCTSHQRLRSETRFRTVAESKFAATFSSARRNRASHKECSLLHGPMRTGSPSGTVVQDTSAKAGSRASWSRMSVSQPWPPTMGFTTDICNRGGGSISGDVAAWLARQWTTCTFRALAAVFGLGHAGSVRNLTRRVDRALPDSRKLQQDIAAIRQEILKNGSD